MIRRDIFGFYFNKNSKIPIHDPKQEGKCPLCCKEIGTRVCQARVFTGKNNRVLFYRIHEDCKKITEERELLAIELAAFNNDE